MVQKWQSKSQIFCKMGESVSAACIKSYDKAEKGTLSPLECLSFCLSLVFGTANLKSRQVLIGWQRLTLYYTQYITIYLQKIVNDFFHFASQELQNTPICFFLYNLKLSVYHLQENAILPYNKLLPELLHLMLLKKELPKLPKLTGVVADHKKFRQ